MSYPVRVFVFSLGLAMLPSLVMAFDTETHALITKQAYMRSVLADTATGDPSFVVKQLGLDRLSESNRLDLYWRSTLFDQIAFYYTDGVGLTGSAYKHPESFERCQMQEFRNGTTPVQFQIFQDTVDSGWAINYDTILPIQNWLVRGAIREDDLGWVLTPFSSSGIHCFGYLLTAEQDAGLRSANHFYDPYLDVGLSTQMQKGPITVPVNGKRSINWALGYQDVYAASAAMDQERENFFSYADARNMFWWALTRQSSKLQSSWQPPYTAAQREIDAGDRMNLWATTFRSLGDVVHLLEDTAQPQHTRNDPHSFVNTPEQKAFEDYTNDRILGLDTGENDYLEGFFDSLPPNFTPPPLGNYPIVAFSTPIRFFTTRAVDGSDPQASRAGLADYTNRGFFTGGTRPALAPATSVEPNPPQPVDVNDNVINGYTTEPASCEGLRNWDARLTDTVTCVHYTHDVPDPVYAAYADNLCNAQAPATCFTHPPLLSDSVLHQVIVEAQSILQGTVSDFHQFQSAIGISEMDITANMTIPRAVGYAAGMMNYFFRGTLTVSAPSDGMYAIVNHGTPHTVNEDGLPICSQTIPSSVDGQPLCTINNIFGFTSVRLNVQNANATQNIAESGTGLPISQSTGGDGAKMVAIARYHRNPCYKPDLSGEDSFDDAIQPHLAADCPLPRTKIPEISVSAEIPVTSGMLDGQQPVTQVFDFSADPIPINATDLFIQVAYRGQLGAETDGIAVGMVDVSEPSYASNFNMLDIEFASQNGVYGWMPWPAPVPDDSKLVVKHAEICQDDSQVYISTVDEQLPKNHVIRIATLRDTSIHTMRQEMTFNFFDDDYSNIAGTNTWTGDVRQADDEQGNNYRVNPYMFYGRGIVLGSGSSDDVQGSNVYDYYFNYNCPGCGSIQITSPWAEQDVPPPANGKGFVSEPIGTVSLPGKIACTLTGDFQPYSIIDSRGVHKIQAPSRGAALRSRNTR